LICRKKADGGKEVAFPGDWGEEETLGFSPRDLTRKGPHKFGPYDFRKTDRGTRPLRRWTFTCYKKGGISRRAESESIRG